MPCVLPVLALKLLALAELARVGRRRAALHAAAYAAGIELTLLALAVAALALRAAGVAVGWGFQLREPLFAAAIAGLLVVLALNLFGVFEIGAPGGRLAGLGLHAAGLRRSFYDGLVAVALATPCSAPFLGTAVGFALASPPAATLAVFLAVGAGLCAPFAAVALVPAWSRRVPRSGAWTARLRTGVGFALLASAVWLVSTLGDRAAPAALLSFLWMLGVGAWIFGQLQAAARRPLARAALLAWLALAAAGLGGVRAAWRGPGETAELAAAPYAPDALAAHLAERRPVFVYFTADWCITCKVNERVVLADPRVQREVERLDVAVLRADWTRRDDAIRAELARVGRAGVPTYLVYHPDAPDRPRALPELLSVERLLAALREARSTT
jgi:thiol:disulfide interchange protein DsbD